MIVIDSSAIIAILRREPEADTFLKAIIDADRVEMSALSAIEVALVLAGSGGDAAVWAPFDDLLERAGIILVPLDREQAKLARQAFLRFGKGRHPARLNLGDCASYALAVQRNAPILYKGDDFGNTDLRTVVSTGSRH